MEKVAKILKDKKMEPTITMKTWVSETHSDEDGPYAKEGKRAIIQGSKKEIQAVAKFLQKVVKFLESNDFCHMHLRDSMKNWTKEEHIDIEVNVEKRVMGQNTY